MISLVLLALFASFLGGIFGLGGGFILLPSLVYAFNIAFKDAAFLSLVSVFFLSALKLVALRELVKPHSRRLIFLAVAAALGALISGILMPKIPVAFLQNAFSVLLVLIGLKLLLERQTSEELAIRTNPFVSIPLFFISGSFSGLFGIGGGVINVPILHKILRFDMKASTALSFYFVFTSSAVAMISQFQTRQDEIRELPPISLLAILVGTLIGSQISNRVKISNEKLKKLFALLVLIMAFSRFI